MAKRRKKLKQRILTYGEIDGRITRHYKKHKNPMCSVPLYGSVEAGIPAINCNHFEIYWMGNLRRAGGPSVNRKVVLARVFAMSDGDTGYVVSGVGKSRNNTEEDAATIKVWKRYVGVFTPHDPKERLIEKHAVGYRIHDGQVIRGQTVWGGPAHPMLRGAWWTLPTANRPDRKRWLSGWKEEFANYPKFRARSIRFANDLRKRLADGPTAVVQLLHRNEGRGWVEPGLQLHVCLPPSRTDDGRRLVVQAAMHTRESRAYHKVSGDYGPRHSQYIAWQQGDDRSRVMRWKCGADALNGIVEWVLGSIHIPGPE